MAKTRMTRTNLILIIALVVLPSVFGFLELPAEMGLSIVGCALALTFANLDKFRRFKGAGFEAVLKETVKHLAPVSANNLAGVTKSLVSSKEEFLIVASVANAAHVAESFMLRTSVPRNGTVAEFLKPLRVQRAISRAQAQASPPGDLRLDEAEPLKLFDWSRSALPPDVQISEITPRVLIAIFDDEMPPAKAAMITKESVRENPEVRDFLKG